MAYTGHGHHIPGTTMLGPPVGKVARCGGPKICRKCKDDVEIYCRANPDDRPKDGVDMNDLDTIDEGRESPQGKAMRLVMDYIEANFEKGDEKPEYECFVVWYAKVLQNWKVLISTTLPDGMYYEVTYNGDKMETYIDAYKKWHNVLIKD